MDATTTADATISDASRIRMVHDEADTAARRGATGSGMAREKISHAQIYAGMWKKDDLAAPFIDSAQAAVRAHDEAVRIGIALDLPAAAAREEMDAMRSTISDAFGDALDDCELASREVDGRTVLALRCAANQASMTPADGQALADETLAAAGQLAAALAAAGRPQAANRARYLGERAHVLAQRLGGDWDLTVAASVDIRIVAAEFQAVQATRA
jgi:hypothetical protein